MMGGHDVERLMEDEEEVEVWELHLVGDAARKAGLVLMIICIASRRACRPKFFANSFGFWGLWWYCGGRRWQ